MQTEIKENMEKGQKRDVSNHDDEKKTQKPSTVKYFYFDKDGRQLSEETVQKLKINVKGNVVLASGLTDSHLDGTSSENPFQNDFQKLAKQLAANVKSEPGKQKTSVPNFQASHNGQIYLVTPDGGLRPAVESSEVNLETKGHEKKQSTEKVMPGTKYLYRNSGTNHINRNGKVKRPMNAFMLWAREFRGKLAEQMPNASNAEISVGLGQIWANLPTPEKQHFYLEAEKVKNQHRRDFPGWVYQPNITKCQNPKDTQHTRMWQRFVSKKAESKVIEKRTIPIPIAPAPHSNKSSSNTSCNSDSTDENDAKKPPQNVTAKITEGSDVMVNGGESHQKWLTLDQQKQQQESKIDAQTIQSTVKQVFVSSNSQPRVYSQPVPSFKEFKKEVLSSEKLKSTTSYVANGSQTVSGDRADKAPLGSTQPSHSTNSSQMTYKPPSVAMGTQMQYSTAFSRGPVPTPEVQVSKLGRPNSNAVKYDYIPQSKANQFVPISRPMVSAAAVVPSTGQISQPSQQKYITLETRAGNQTMVNQFVPKQMNTAPQHLITPHQASVNQSHSPDYIQQPIAIPTLPNLNDKANPIWPFPFPPVEQGPQTHLLYEGSVPENINPKTILSDPYAPFYFDNYVNQVRPPELQVDVNGWQQYLSDDQSCVRGNLAPGYVHKVKQCPSDLEICPYPASQTLSRNQTKQSSSGAGLTSSVSTGSMTNASNEGAVQMNMIQQGGSSTSLTTSISQESTLPQAPANVLYDHQNQQLQAIQHAAGDNQQELEGNVIHITPVQTPSGQHIGTMIQNFGSSDISINPVHYRNENMYQYVPQLNNSAPRSQGKSVEFGSVMSSAFNAINGDLDGYDNTPERYPIHGYNETVPSMLPQAETQQFCIQPSGSNENFQTISKYQDENNRPIKKRSYKIIEGLLENEVWMAQHRPMKTMSAIVQSQSDPEDGGEAIGSKSDDEVLRKEGKINNQDTRDLNGEEYSTNAPSQAIEGDRAMEGEENTIVNGEVFRKEKGTEDAKVKGEGDNEGGACDLKGEEKCIMTEVEDNMMGSYSNEQCENDNAVIECNENIQEKTNSNAVSMTGSVLVPSKGMESKHEEEITEERAETTKGDDLVKVDASVINLQENNQIPDPQQSLCDLETKNTDEPKSEIPIIKTEAEIYEAVEDDIEIKTEPPDEDTAESSVNYLYNETNEETYGNAEDAENYIETNELSQLEIVIDNAETMSPTHCEDQCHISNDFEMSSEMKNQLDKISKNQLSEILEDESSSDLDKIKTRDSVQKSEEIFKSIKLVKKNRSNMVDTKKKPHCQNTQYQDCQNTQYQDCQNTQYQDYSNLQSGDATASVEKIALESEKPLPSLVRSRNKRRRPQESPVRASKRQRN